MSLLNDVWGSFSVWLCVLFLIKLFLSFFFWWAMCSRVGKMATLGDKDSCVKNQRSACLNFFARLTTSGVERKGPAGGGDGAAVSWENGWPILKYVDWKTSWRIEDAHLNSEQTAVSFDLQEPSFQWDFFFVLLLFTAESCRLPTKTTYKNHI